MLRLQFVMASHLMPQGCSIIYRKGEYLERMQDNN